MPTNLPDRHYLRQLEGYETVPDPVPPQTYTLCFLAALVAVTLSAFVAVVVFGFNPF